VLVESHYPPDGSGRSFGHDVKKLLQVYRERGVDLTPTLAEAGIDAATLAADTMLPTRQVLQWIDDVLARFPKPGLGLTAATSTGVHEYGMLGYTVMSAASFGDVLGLWLRYGSALLARNHGGGFRRDGALGELYAIEPDARPYGERLRVFLHERSMGSWLAIVRTLLGPDLRFTDVRFVHPEPEWSARYRELFGCPVYFRQRETLVRFPLEWLERTTRFANGQVRALCQAQCDALLAQMRAAGGATDEVRRRLLERPAESSTLDGIAAVMHLSPRTLRRKLADEGTSFSAVQLELRMQLARDHLRNSLASVADIASLLGYADESAFGRAFKRAAGRSPLQFRRLREAAV